MARYRKIDTRIWNDEKFRDLSDDGKLVFFFLLTHPHMTSIGAMRATIPGLAAEIGWVTERLSEAFAEALSMGMAKHDSLASMVWLPKFIRYNEPESPNVLKAWAGAIDLLPECDLTRQAVQEVKDFVKGLSEAFQKALPKAFAEGWRTPSLIPEQEPEPRTGTGKERPLSLVGKAAVKGHGDVTLKRFFEICKEAGQEPIPPDDPIFTYAAKVGISTDLLHLAWRVFRDKHLERQKRQADWRATFRNCVKDNWYGLWTIDASNECVVTGKGRQAMKAHAK